MNSVIKKQGKVFVILTVALTVLMATPAMADELWVGAAPGSSTSEWFRYDLTGASNLVNKEIFGPGGNYADPRSVVFANGLIHIAGAPGKIEQHDPTQPVGSTLVSGPSNLAENLAGQGGFAAGPGGGIYATTCCKGGGTDQVIQINPATGATINPSVLAAATSWAFAPHLGLTSTNIYVADNGTINRYDSSGNFLNSLATGSSWGMDVGHDGNLYVAQIGTGDVLKIAPDLSSSSVFASPGGAVWVDVHPFKNLVYVANSATFGGDDTVKVYGLTSGLLKQTLTLDATSIIPIAVTPEPATLGLMALGGLMILRRRSG